MQQKSPNLTMPYGRIYNVTLNCPVLWAKGMEHNVIKSGSQDSGPEKKHYSPGW